MKRYIIFIILFLLVFVSRADEIFVKNKVISEPELQHTDITKLIIANWLSIEERKYQIGDGPTLVTAFPDLLVLYDTGNLTSRYNRWVERFYQNIEKAYGKESLEQYKYKYNFIVVPAETIDFMKRTYDPNLVGKE